MLAHLAIRNLALIESTDLELGPGLNVLTGETGAGKSVIVGALSLALGGRSRADVVRSGAEQAEVQALFRLSPGGRAAERLRELALAEGEGAASEPAELIVRRLVASGGRSRVFLNGVLSTVGTLGEVLSEVVDLTGQHEHTALADPRGHLALCDRFGALDRELIAYRHAWEAWVGASAAARALAGEQRQRLEREDFVRFQLEEIERASPRAGEEVELAAERDRLVHAERLIGGARLAEDLLAGREGAAVAQLADAARTLERLAAIDAQLGVARERLESARLEVQDVAFDLRRYADKIELDPRRLVEVEERLESLKRLMRKHGPSLEEVLARADELRNELGRFESLDEALAGAQGRLEVAQAELMRVGATLSEARRLAARGLGERVGTELAELAMAGAAATMTLEPLPEPGPDGLDRAELLIRTNRGEAFLPIARVASGGELSRLLLALKCTLADVETGAVCVFDEVDAGVGGAVGEVIGRKLRALARTRQVIVITHLPQVAALADVHFQVEKAEVGDRVVTRVRRLLDGERTEEVARMLGGLRVTSRTRAHAEELMAGTAS